VTIIRETPHFYVTRSTQGHIKIWAKDKAARPRSCAILRSLWELWRQYDDVALERACKRELGIA
jgi:hypothetical protein